MCTLLFLTYLPVIEVFVAIVVCVVPMMEGIALGIPDRAAPEPASYGTAGHRTAGWNCITPHAIFDCPQTLAPLGIRC